MSFLLSLKIIPLKREYYNRFILNYIKFRGGEKFDEIIKTDQEFLEFMDKIKKVDEESYGKMGGRYLEKILTKKSE